MKREKCHQCGKKLGVVPLKCKCGFHFCSAHFFFLNHTCSYDYKKEYDSNRNLGGGAPKKINQI